MEDIRENDIRAYVAKLKKIFSKILKIPNDLKISFNGEFDTISQRCVLHIEENVKEILINMKFIKKFGYDKNFLLFAIAHECRHYYQILKGVNFEEYKLSNATSLEDYNKQITEIDANAFGSLMVKMLLGLQILLPFKKDILSLIENREKEIINELGLKF